MTSLTDFLLARIVEDEHHARAARGWQTGTRHEGQPLDWSIHMDRWSPDRVLAECEGKRRILEHCDATSHCGSYLPPGAERDEWLAESRIIGFTPPLHYPEEYAAGCDGCSAAESVNQNDGWVLRYLALPYAHHPDYDKSWNPES